MTRSPFPEQTVGRHTVAFFVFSDLVPAIYPLFTIADLKLAMKVKIGLGFVLSLGIV